MVAVHRVTITLLSDILAQAVLVLYGWMCSGGGVTRPWGDGGQLVKGSFHIHFHLLCTIARDRLMQLSI